MLTGSASRRRARRPEGEGEAAAELLADGAGDGPKGELLDIDEQATVIAELRRKGEQQSRSTRRVFQALSTLLLLALLYCAGMALGMPFLLEHQLFFKASVSPGGFVLSYALDAACVLVAISTFSGKRDRTLLLAGFAAGGLNLLGWLGVFAQYTPYPGVGFWWLPVTGLFIQLAALYVDADLRKLHQDIDGLERLKYEYKKV